MTSGYQYCRNDLLEKPQTYQRSIFEGIDFLNSYKKNRLDVIKLCDIVDFSISVFLNDLKKHAKPSGAEFELEDYLCFLLIDSKSDSYYTENHTDLFLKKFEIKKRLFAKYDSNFKEISDNYYNLRNYILLALMCLLQYEKNSSLKYLNTCLKLNDTICSQVHKLTAKDKPFFCYVIRQELKHIDKLCTNKGIMI